ncbi:MAG: glucose-6-phosphate isomerase [Halobacteriaceae archaeon]
MRVDIGNALAAVASPGVPRGALERLDDRVEQAHERIATGRAGGEFGYAALDLPETVDLGAVRDAAAEVAVDPEAVLVVGIGGSALGAATLAAAVDPPVPVHVLDNVDPAETRALLADLPLARTAVNVVSESGTTTETLANFLVVRDAMAAADVDWTDRTLVTTGEAGPLRALADREGLPTLPTPPGAPGRFSALSPVGLAPLVLAGAGEDAAAMLAGARDVDLSGSLFDCPAYAYGATAYALDARGAAVNAMCPYAESLDRFAEWFGQLWAESLGKDGLGQTPVRTLGATDQHSQLQLWRAGPRDKLVTLVRPTERPTVPIPDPGEGALAHLAGEDLGGLLDAEFGATEASLAAAGRPSVRVEVERVDARGVGELCYGMEAACVLAGELYGVETFTQPAVEWGKRATRGLLGAADGREEAAAVGRKSELVVE